MRFLSFCIVLLGLFLSTSLYGQLTKSSFLIGSDLLATGGVLFDNYIGLESNLVSAELNSFEDQRSFFGIILSPTVGYFITDHWAVGSGLIFASSFYSQSFNTTNVYLLNVRPFVRYYANPQAKNCHYFLEGHYRRLIDLGSSDFKSSGAAAYAGLTYRLNSSILLDGQLGYSTGNLSSNAERNGSIDIGATLNILLSDHQEEGVPLAPAIGKGSFATGLSSFSLSAASEDANLDRTFSFRPKLLYFVNDRWAFGTGIDYSIARRRFSTLDQVNGGGFFRAKFKNIGLSFTPQARYYFTPPRRVTFFATTGLEIRYEITRLDEVTAEIFGSEERFSENSTNINLGLGANVFITPNFALEFGPNYRYDGEAEVARFAIDAGIQVVFGAKKQ